MGEIWWEPGETKWGIVSRGEGVKSSGHHVIGNWNSVGRESNVIVIYHQSVILRVQYDKYCTLVSQSELLYFCVLVIMKITSIDEKLFANPIYVIINY